MTARDINTLATWIPIHNDELDVKIFGDGYPFKQNGILLQATAKDKVYRYAKNYSLDKTKYSLCFTTLDRNIEKVEAWLDEQASKITKDDLNGSFKMLGVRYE